MMCNTSVVYIQSQKKKRWAAFDMIAFDDLKKKTKNKKNRHVLKQDNKRR